MSRYIGNVSAYAYAVEKGYTGTEEEFALLMASYATVGQTAVEAAQTATTKASEASQSATTAINKASEATTAAQTATTKASEAQTNAQTASTKASEATTAAIAAQTAKTQTEQAASQALTDIATARSGAISTVQTEGATQTANATAQAQAAATSATTASTKASEASASATTATTKATEAAASATSAAQSASDAQDVLDSIPADYSDLSANVSQLQADLGDLDDSVDDLKSAFENTADQILEERTISKSASVTIPSNTGIVATTKVLDFDIPVGTNYTYKVDFGSSISRIPALYIIDSTGNVTALKYEPVNGRVYTATSANNISGFSLYIPPQNVTSDAVITITASYVKMNNDSMELKLKDKINQIDSEVGDGIVEQELIDGAVVVTRKKAIEVGAYTNNDNNLTYIYHKLVFDRAISGSVSIYASDVQNAIYTTPIIVYFKDSENTLVKEYDLTVAKIQRGLTLIPPANATKYSVLLYPSITGGLTDINAIYKDVVIIESPYAEYYFKWLSDNRPKVPYYYLQNDYIEGKITTIQNLMINAGGDYDAFIFCTDQHWRLNAQQSPSLIRYICDRLNIKRLFMGGDMEDGINIDVINAYETAFRGRIYKVTGNHEYMNYFEKDGIRTGTTINSATVWIYLDAGMMDAVVGNANRQYYYIDNPVQKMRYIILNVYADNGASAIAQFETAQKNWFQNIALDLPSGYTAIVFSHYLYSVDYNTGEITVPTITTEIENIVDTYSGNGEIACLVSGHTHVDGMTATSSGIPAFITTCDKYMPWVDGGVDKEPWLTANRHLGTITEQAFDVVVIDKKNKKVSFVRIGAPADNGEGEKLQIREQAY